MSVFNQKSSIAAAASLVAKASSARVLHVQGYNAKASAQFIQLIDAATVPSDVVSGVAEISTVDTTGATPAGLANKYLLLSGATANFYVWFNLDAAGVDPAVASHTGIAVPIATGNSAAQLATALASAVDAHADFVATPSTNLVTITDAATGARTDIAAGNSGLAVAVTQQGVTAIAATVPLAVITAAASSNFQIPLPADGLHCGAGVVVCNSSTYATKTAGSADCFFTVVTT